MSYNTSFTLKIDGIDNDLISSALTKDICTLLGYQVTTDISLIYFEGKYYSIQGELKELAKKYPLLVFDLSAEGEDHNDTWRLMIKGHKSCYKKAVPVVIDIRLGELK